MSNRKTTLFYALLIAIASLAVGMVIASRLDLSPESSAQTLAAPPYNNAPITGGITATTFRDVAKAVTPAVVNIRTESRQRTQDLSEFFGGGGGGQGDDLFQRFFGQGDQAPQRQQRPREQVVQAAGTGFIIDKAGFILTNNHVVEGATKIEVSLFGEEADQEYAARVVGRDPLTDSALIELTEKPNHPLPEVKFGDSAQMEQGDWVMAIGNPFGLAHTVSVGVISANSRPFPVADGRTAQVLQTDAAINPGNSGGALINNRGELVGINTGIYSESGGYQGIGFAVPSRLAQRIVADLMKFGEVQRGSIGYIGIEKLSPQLAEEFGVDNTNGALVSRMSRASEAYDAGIRPGDVIVGFNGQDISDPSQFLRLVSDAKVGTTVTVKVLRAGRTLEFKLPIVSSSTSTLRGRR